MTRLLVAAALYLLGITAAFSAGSILSNLPNGGAVTSGDLFYDVQHPGLGGTKVTASQLRTFMVSSPQIANITRAQIPTTLIGPGTFMVNGYRTVNDLGAGAIYSSVGANCTNGLMYVFDSGGTCFNLVISTTVNVGWFGTYADDGAHTIAAADLTANPQWKGTYSAGQTWDYVASQEAIYAAFATTSTPGVINWNVNTNNSSNVLLFVPTGIYGINAKLLAVANGFTIKFESRLSTFYDWVGTGTGTAWELNSGAYGLLENFGVQCNQAQSYGSVVPCLELENNASPGGLDTQQLTFINSFVQVGQNGRGIAHNFLSGGTQNDTVTYINPYFAGDGATSEWGLQINGGNTLEITIIGGDCQGFAHDCIQNNGGQVRVYGMGFQNENKNFRGVQPMLNQVVTGGADLDIPSGNTGTIPSAMNNIRTEAEVLAQAYGGGVVDVTSSESRGADAFPSYGANISAPDGLLVQQGTKQRWFVVVDDGGQCQQWCAISSKTSNTITDNSASYSVNALVGQALYSRFSSNGVVQRCAITSNTATTITVSGCTFSSENLYMVVGLTGGSPPSWDTAPLGNSTTNNLTLTTHAGSNCVNTNLVISVNQYIVIPYADLVSPPSGSTIPNTLYAKVTGTSGSPCSWGGSGASITLNKNANLTINTTPNIIYYGTGFADNQVTWLQVPFDAINTGGSGQVINFAGLGQVVTAGPVIGGNYPVGIGWYDATNPNNLGPQFGHLNAAPMYLPGAIQTWACAPTGSSPIDLSSCIAASSVLAFQPSTAMTFNAPTMPANSQFLVMFLESNGSSQVVTFGTNFISTGTLTTSSVNGAFSVIIFMNENILGSNKFVEVSRSPPTTGAGTNSTVASPAGPNSTVAFKMQGLAGTITPKNTGNINLQICGTITETGITAAGSGVQYQLSYGTGGAPTSNAALTGTQVGTVQEYMLANTVTAADVFVPFCQTAVITGLTTGTAYWLDLAAEAVANTGFAFSNVNVAAHEF